MSKVQSVADAAVVKAKNAFDSLPAAQPSQQSGQNDAKVVETGTNYNYNFGLVDEMWISKRTFIVFGVKAASDVHICLSKELNPGFSNDGTPMCEIVIGGWSNTKSVIRAAKQGQPLLEHYGSLLNGQEQQFWVSWQDCYVRVGRGSIVGQYEFMQVNKGIFQHEFKYLHCSTGFGSAGSWKFYLKGLPVVAAAAVVSANVQYQGLQAPANNSGMLMGFTSAANSMSYPFAQAQPSFGVMNYQQSSGFVQPQQPTYGANLQQSSGFSGLSVQQNSGFTGANFQSSSATTATKTTTSTSSNYNSGVVMNNCGQPSSVDSGGAWYSS